MPIDTYSDSTIFIVQLSDGEGAAAGATNLSGGHAFLEPPLCPAWPLASQFKFSFKIIGILRSMTIDQHIRNEHVDQHSAETSQLITNISNEICRNVAL